MSGGGRKTAVTGRAGGRLAGEVGEVVAGEVAVQRRWGEERRRLSGEQRRASGEQRRRVGKNGKFRKFVT